jgi:hypothetical protein
MSKQATGSKLAVDVAADAAAVLLANYSFDLGRYKAAELVERWLNSYPAEWVLLAAIEALYQGRYKAKSIEQILTIWTRRQQPLYHFNQEFEILICRKLPAHLTYEGLLGAYSQEESKKSNEPTKIAPGKTDGTMGDAGNKEVQQYVSPFDAMSGASVAIAASSVEPTQTIPPQPAEPTLASSSPPTSPTPSLPSEYEKLIVPRSWATKIGPIDQFEPAQVESHLYSKLKTLADSVEESVSG